MSTVLFLFFVFITLLPGLLLLIGAWKFNLKVRHVSGVLILIGSMLLLLALAMDSGTYFFSFFRNAEQLADYTLKKTWIGGIAQFLGIILVSIGLLLFRKE